ncbi:claudin-19-like [Notolabrus celidotus]|uniref:claudin-19-like n=1 Tax=Notolabrus celidotus TaxID=1203425 RepID=UPI00149038B9|nr:claudin-19-like [Notolabrus celidotus]
MASSGLQLLGFFLSLVGLAATVAATLMVEWKKQSQGKTHRIYEGLWMSCSGNERTTCELHQSLLKLPTEVQATRAVMLLSILLSAVALLVSTVGMKCTHFMDEKPDGKSTTAMTGGILFIIAGLLTVVITSWYVSKIVSTFQVSHRLESFEFGKAVFVSWAGGLLTIAGGAFLGCRRCSRAGSSESLSVNHLLPSSSSSSNPNSNYV